VEWVEVGYNMLDVFVYVCVCMYHGVCVSVITYQILILSNLKKIVYMMCGCGPLLLSPFIQVI
jgi:hypothetical protein